ncbi:MAG: hypothetical protein JWM74_4750 [Myxococcaceae bacterium]|nr:hypothetical protein [Myxococcaceae bacterium]
MAIDRIGKGAGLPQAPEGQGAGGAGGAKKTDATFKVDRPDATRSANEVDATRAGNVEASAPTSATSPTSPLGRLRAGEVDVHGYIDLKVDQATSALKGLSAAELDEIKSVLRDQMKSDPGLADLVRTATGKMPTPPED